MARLTYHRAFQLGYLPPVAGLFFNSQAFIDGARRQPHLRERAAQRSALLHNPDPSQPTPPDILGQIEALLAEVELPCGARPADLTQYTDWTQRIGREVRGLLAEDLKELAAYNLGALLGDVALTLSLLALVHELRPRPDEEPPWLSAQRRGLMADVERARIRLALLCRANPPTLPAEVIEESSRCLRHLDADISTAPAAANLYRQLVQRVSAIEAALAPPRPRARSESRP